MNSNDLHTLTAAYALDALDQPERQRYERHLADCSACRTELRGFHEVSGQLAAVAAIDAPSALREGVLTAVANDSQPSATPMRRRQRRWRFAALAAVAAAAVAAAAIFGVIAANAHDHLTANQHEQREIAAVISAPDCKILRAQLRTGGTATVLMSPHMRTLVVTTAGLHPAPSGLRYQLWLLRDSGDIRVGTLPASGSGPVMVLADGAPAGQRLGISLEHDLRPHHPRTPMEAVIPL